MLLSQFTMKFHCRLLETIIIPELKMLPKIKDCCFLKPGYSHQSSVYSYRQSSFFVSSKWRDLTQAIKILLLNSLYSLVVKNMIQIFEETNRLENGTEVKRSLSLYDKTNECVHTRLHPKTITIICLFRRLLHSFAHDHRTHLINSMFSAQFNFIIIFFGLETEIHIN